MCVQYLNFWWTPRQKQCVALILLHNSVVKFRVHLEELKQISGFYKQSWCRWWCVRVHACVHVCVCVCVCVCMHKFKILHYNLTMLLFWNLTLTIKMARHTVWLNFYVMKKFELMWCISFNADPLKLFLSLSIINFKIKDSKKWTGRRAHSSVKWHLLVIIRTRLAWTPIH